MRSEEFSNFVKIECDGSFECDAGMIIKSPAQAAQAGWKFIREIKDGKGFYMGTCPRHNRTGAPVRKEKP